MSIVKRNNLIFPTLMNEIFKPDWFGGIENFTNVFPAVNIRENEKDFELELAAPGRNKENFNIEIDHEVLTVSYEVKEVESEKEKNYTRREFTYSTFKRSFTLPETVDSERIDAKYVDGVLKLTLPKKEEALPKPKRLIDLS